MGEKPPCAKCKREHRDCRFDRRPKTAKHRELPAWAGKRTSSRIDSSPARQTRTTQRGASLLSLQESEPEPRHEETAVEDIAPPTSSESGRTLWPQPSLQGNPSFSDRVVSGLVTGSNDALDVLSDAATLIHNSTISPSSAPLSTQQLHYSSEAPIAVPVGGPPGCQGGVGFAILSLSEPADSTLDMWDKCRFVRQGWFTSQEAVTFFKYLSPLSAVVTNQYRSHEAHPALICEESMLCCTLLMISSRFFMLPGAGGASRSHLIHNRLWQYCETLIKRIILGQEKISTAKMRIIGTIESLLLISDWHPRAVHFPPDTEGWDAGLVDTEYDRRNRKRVNNEDPLVRWRKDVFDPAKRASRMSWMLLGLATNLAYELGILSNDSSAFESALNKEGSRRYRTQKLLYAYMTQTATRLGYHSVLPESVCIAASRSTMKDTTDTAQLSWNTYMDAYLELCRLSKIASSMFFQSTGHLQGVLQNDNYPELLDHYQESLCGWHDTFEPTFKKHLRDSLLIELYHLKACIGAISIQAVVQRATRCATRSPKDGFAVCMTAQDARFLQEVISDSSRALHIATVTPFRTHLAYAPDRTRLNVISASVFLLKAISIGSPATDLQAAFETLGQCTTTLKTYPPDDMDFAMRYADLIEKHTFHMRSSFSSSSQSQAGRCSGQPAGDGGGQDASASMADFDIEASTRLFDQAGGDPSVLDLSDFWKASQFDASIAPFGETADQLSQGFDIDSLNFLWNLPDISG
ncbi:hypothetical protein CMUS01_03123 [Colletotrichum musicola]|uniref:Zn(2)-C6 fungal-type domain-containing protein n=1 Tax=Colletotrichum musicola TaxID=2175873 RepID=A0A8H6NTX5_9PEZI|nr:hypothetical protein CMUS01_03123 [Colletotrichum musicola]